MVGDDAWAYAVNKRGARGGNERANGGEHSQPERRKKNVGEWGIYKR
jgi:hypothetical protein